MAIKKMPAQYVELKDEKEAAGNSQVDTITMPIYLMLNDSFVTRTLNRSFNSLKKLVVSTTEKGCSTEEA